MDLNQACACLVDYFAEEPRDEMDRTTVEALEVLEEQGNKPPLHDIVIGFEYDEGMAPQNKLWHFNYAMAMQQITALFGWLHEQSYEHPEFKKAAPEAIWDVGDLGDYVEMMRTMMSFRPHTLPEIEQQAREALEGQEAE